MTALWVSLLVLTLGAVALVVAGTVAQRHPGDPQAKAAQREAKRARREEKAAERAHQRAVRAAGREVDAAARRYRDRVGAAQRRLTDLRSVEGRQLGYFQGITLYERYIRTPQGSGPVMGAQARADTAGNLMTTSRATLTRMAAGGLLLGPLGAVLSLGFKKHATVDNRELYLLIETPSFAAVVQCPPQAGLQARQFAAMITTVGIQAAAAESARPRLISEAAFILRQAEADTSEINRAQQRLTEIQAAAPCAATETSRQVGMRELPPAPTSPALPAGVNPSSAFPDMSTSSGPPGPVTGSGSEPANQAVGVTPELAESSHPWTAITKYSKVGAFVFLALFLAVTAAIFAMRSSDEASSTTRSIEGSAGGTPTSVEPLELTLQEEIVSIVEEEHELDAPTARCVAEMLLDRFSASSLEASLAAGRLPSYTFRAIEECN